jgi:U3 small nucleolar RNA-associated protein MPP10
LYDLSDESGDEDDLRYEDFFSSKAKGKGKAKSARHEVGGDDESDELDYGSGSDGLAESNEDLEDGSEEDEEEDGDEEGSEDEGDDSSHEGEHEEQNLATTTYGKEKQKMQKQIADIESQMMEAKSWERKGEVKSGDRPENSLLGLAVAVERSLGARSPLLTYLS